MHFCFLIIILFSLNSFATDNLDCREKENRAAFEKKAKALASDHCKGKYQNLFISDAALKLEKTAVATHLISFECKKPFQKFHAVLQLKPEDNCSEIQFQRILAVPVK